jgi:hypothetical protein
MSVARKLMVVATLLAFLGVQAVCTDAGTITPSGSSTWSVGGGDAKGSANSDPEEPSDGLVVGGGPTTTAGRAAAPTRVTGLSVRTVWQVLRTGLLLWGVH